MSSAQRVLAVTCMNKVDIRRFPVFLTMTGAAFLLELTAMGILMAQNARSGCADKAGGGQRYVGVRRFVALVASQRFVRPAQRVTAVAAVNKINVPAGPAPFIVAALAVVAQRQPVRIGVTIRAAGAHAAEHEPVRSG